MSGEPSMPPGVWQSEQPPIVTRYRPRATCASSAVAAEAKLKTAAAAINGACALMIFRIFVSLMVLKDRISESLLDAPELASLDPDRLGARRARLSLARRRRSSERSGKPSRSSRELPAHAGHWRHAAKRGRGKEPWRPLPKTARRRARPSSALRHRELRRRRRRTS